MDQVDKHRTVITLDHCRINASPVNYKIRLYVYKNDLGYETGDDLFINPVKLTIPNGAVNPDGFDFNAYLWRSGVALTASASPDDITLIGEQTSLKSALLRIRKHLVGVCDNVFGESSDVIRAVLLGDRSMLTDNTYDDFAASGISHLIALSGLHVSALALMLEFVFRKMRIPRAIRYALTVVLLSFYAVLTGASVSTIRAVLMYTILCMTRLAGYYSDTLTRLSQALLIQLGANPLLIHDNGFMLSYASVAAILCFGDLYSFSSASSKSVLKGLLQSAKSSFAVQVICFPLLAGMFYSVPILSVPVNVLCVPLAELALYASVVLLLLGCFSAPVAAVLAYPVKTIWRLIKEISAWIADLSFAKINATSWSVLLVFIFLCAVIFGCVYMTASKKRRVVSVFMLLSLIAISLIPAKPIDHLRVTFLSVGEADSAVFDAQGNVYVLDCGKDNGIAADFLTAHGANVRGLFITHADSDHYGGSADILARYPDAKVYLPACWNQMKVGDDLSIQLQGRTISYLKQGDTVELSNDIHADILWPPNDFELRDDNSGSLILHVVYNDYSILMMADLSDKYDVLACADADVLRIAHHGSKNASSVQMLSAVTPDIAIVSVGNNSYGHPAPEVIERLDNVGARIFRTDLLGAITLDIYADGSARVSTVLDPEE